MSYFEDLKAGFDRKDLKRFYIKLVKAHPPELDPNNFRKINEEYEHLLLRLRYPDVLDVPTYEDIELVRSDDLEDSRIEHDFQEVQVEQVQSVVEQLDFDARESPEKLSFEQLLCLEEGNEDFLKIFRSWLDKGGIEYCLNHIEEVFDQLEQIAGISSLERVSYYEENNLQMVLPVVSWLNLSRTHKIKQHMDHAFHYLDQEGGVYLYDELHRSYAQMRYQCQTGGDCRQISVSDLYQTVRAATSPL